MVVIGRERTAGPTAHLGHYRARDGSRGTRVEMDLDAPHAGVVVGKRGSGKTYTLGVLAEDLAAASGVAPVVADPMGAFAPLADAAVDATVVCPTVRADALGPRAWCTLLGLDPERGPGTLVWQAATETMTLPKMCEWIEDADAPGETRRAAANHLAMARSWGVFDADGLAAQGLRDGGVTVLNLSGIDRAPANAVVAAVATALYDARIENEMRRLPWLLVDEAHAFTNGVAERALRRLLTRGRHPGVSCWLATQRPSALPAVALSQVDLLIAHRLTSEADVGALTDARPTYLSGDLGERLPAATGEALVVDDVTESTHHVQVRERRTPHGGDSPRASAVGEP
ncbi:ATP-binding protein [Haloarcula amylovorans]|uniref:ATP-binding protein n=1 Tax=Haloarcula amylovorans TaxID=2562280 RepID=UPI0010767C89|nr:ATP-binding protein [Halomicroarcula amylolytica]